MAWTLNTLAYARYVAPTYHFGSSDDSHVPLGTSAPATHRLVASAGVAPAATAPALSVSSSFRDAGTDPRVAANLFGRF